ncbi:MAG TPA: Smr/MutS family protein [Candidatus Binatia bacterium]|nr:Smr/MutS family protein [Candidatus Binatia bacterium]
MATRDRKQPRSGDRHVSENGFHSPFADLARTIKEDRKTQRKAQKKAEAASAPPPAPAPEVPASGKVTDEEAFAAAVAGAAPMVRVHGPLRRSYTPDLAGIGAHRDANDLAYTDTFDISFHDHYVRGRAADVSRETLVQLEKGMFAVSAHLDLHGMTLEDARAAVDDFLREQQRRGHRCVLLVTGKGKNSPRQQGVLREKVPEWLARGPSARRIIAFVSARPCDGGLGALYVLMRRGSSRKNRIDVELGGVGGLES